MNIRPIDWRDLPVIRRYRNQCLFFDSTLALTRGPLLDWARTLFASVAPAQGVFTYLAVEDDHTVQPVLGQATFLPGASSARLTCLAPENALESTGIGPLLDFIITDLGEHGAFHVLAEADECQQACETLHEMGFAIYARQRIWQLNRDPAEKAIPAPWRPCTDQDGINIRSLYNNLTPGLVQQMEPIPTRNPRGMVYYQGQDLLAYVDLKSGPNGIWAQPFIHPDVEDVPAMLAMPAAKSSRSPPATGVSVCAFLPGMAGSLRGSAGGATWASPGCDGQAPGPFAACGSNGSPAGAGG